MTLTAREGRETMAHSLVLAFLLIQSAMASKLMENVHAIEVLLGHALSNGKESHGCYGQLLEASTQAKMVQNLVLVAHHKDALRGLESLILHLNSCTEANIDHTIYALEEELDVSNQALNHAIRAKQFLLKQINCQYQACNPKRIHDYYNYQQKQAMSNCQVDGTKCQFSACASGNRLPVCAMGFAAGTTGGATGKYYIVTDPSDNNPANPKPGTLRYAVELAERTSGGVWIMFKGNMVINLMKKLWIKSHTTIDGRGAIVTIKGKGLVLGHVENIIIHNVAVGSTGESDTIHVFDGSHHVWIDHVASFDADLGLVTVLQGATDVTVSNSYLTNPNFNMLLGASDEDVVDQHLRVTVYRNWFDSSNQRMPHCRWGYCHVVNNYYKDWNYYAIGGRAHAKILSEQNVFEPGRRLEVTPWFQHFHADLTPIIESRNDRFLNNATFHQFLVYGTLSEPDYQYTFYYPTIRSTETLRDFIKKCSGPLNGQKLDKCRKTA